MSTRTTVLSRPTSRDDFFMASPDDPRPAAGFLQALANNPAHVVWKLFTMWSFGPHGRGIHGLGVDSSGSLSSMASSSSSSPSASPRVGYRGLSRSASGESIQSSGSGVFLDEDEDEAEDQVEYPGRNSSPRSRSSKDSRLPQAQIAISRDSQSHSHSFIASIFKFLEAFLPHSGG
jgi:hypothetical protein